jgi:phenylalanyl-tRNA synthetase beta chain
VNISYRWLRELVPGLEAAPSAVADTLAMLGAPVDDIVDIGSQLRDIVVARVTHAEQHPNADRLRLCRVDAGSGTELQVVCGAPNVRAGAWYPFAPVGAELPGGLKIRKAKIRGSESQGMLCSARELCLGRDHEGILELHGDFAAGASFIESAGLDDHRLEVDVTPNRPDLLSHVGIAREVAAAYGLALRHEPAAVGSTVGDAVPTPTAGPIRSSGGGVSVRVDDADLCPHYMGIVIRGVQVKAAPEWLAGRLRAIGLRPINNIVDVTNYVLHELGHPLHAFDLDRLGDTVVVRRARAGESITTLDGAVRKLDAGMLVIADAERPVAVAGIMGGADTEVTSETRNVFLECAVFDPATVRATRRALGLATDASYRFERGVDPLGTPFSAGRAAELIREVTGGTIADTPAFATTGPAAPVFVRLRQARIEQVLGVRFEGDAVRTSLEPLGFEVDEEEPGILRVAVPGHRRFDVSREEDLIEEVARRHGYDAFPAELRPFRPGSVPTHPLFVLEDRLRALLVARGLLELRTAAFAPAADGDVGLLLPLATTESHLRRSLLPGLLRRVEFNFARAARSIRIFEIGTVFAPSQDGGAPVESTRLALALSGPRTPPHWTAAAEPFDVWDLKAIAQEVAALLGCTVQPAAEHALLDPDLSFRLVGPHDEDMGRAGRVLRGRIDAPAWAAPVWILEVDLPAGGRTVAQVQYQELPQHPAIERDLALLTGRAISADEVGRRIRAASGDLLEAAVPFDVYTGEGVSSGTSSVAWRLRFRAPDRTLTDAEVDAVIRSVLDRLEADLGVVPRA